MRKAETNRSVASTACNKNSSRSHSIFQLKLSAIGENGKEVTKTLSLVDLAGSERLEHTKVEGERLKETTAINKSLSTLADVISALKDGKHVPFRNSKLTYFLQKQQRPFLVFYIKKKQYEIKVQPCVLHNKRSFFVR